MTGEHHVERIEQWPVALLGWVGGRGVAIFMGSRRGRWRPVGWCCELRVSALWRWRSRFCGRFDACEEHGGAGRCWCCSIVDEHVGGGSQPQRCAGTRRGGRAAGRWRMDWENGG